jgi:GGDEF domain-containing protein
MESVASAISRGIRKNGLVGRIGGEKFAVLFPFTGKDEAAGLADKLLELVAVLFSHAPASKSALSRPSHPSGCLECADG